MNNGLVNRIKNWVAGDPFEDDVYNVEEDYEVENRLFRQNRREQEPVQEVKKQKNSLKLVDHPNSQMAQVVVIEPRAFEESLEIIEHLRAKKSVILNLHLLDNAQSQRVVDFLSGATHAIDGNQQRIGDGVFIFTPSNVVISSDNDKEQLGLAGLNEALLSQYR
jgi:cell division inhibitor SepF